MNDTCTMFACICETAPPVAVPSIVSTVTITSLSSVVLPCTDTLTETLEVLSVMMYDVASNPIVTAEEEENGKK